MKHPDAVFGPDAKTHTSADTRAGNPVSYASIAQQIREMDVRALTPDQCHDVLTLMEYLQKECIRQHDDNTKFSQALDAHRAELELRERQLDLRLRTANAVIATNRIHPSRVGGGKVRFFNLGR